MRDYQTDAEMKALFDGKLAMLNRLRNVCDALALEIAEEADVATMALKDKVDVVLAAGHKIYAIKIYRVATGASLLEAKEYVENPNR